MAVFVASFDDLMDGGVRKMTNRSQCRGNASHQKCSDGCAHSPCSCSLKYLSMNSSCVNRSRLEAYTSSACYEGEGESRWDRGVRKLLRSERRCCKGCLLSVRAEVL
jgi:hypothetical protein